MRSGRHFMWLGVVVCVLLTTLVLTGGCETTSRRTPSAGIPGSVGRWEAMAGPAARDTSAPAAGRSVGAAIAGEELWVIAKAAPDPSRRQEDRPGSGMLMAKEGDKLVPVPLKHTDVQAQVAAYLSSTTVRQQFHNPYNGKIEAVYVFPLPETAAINEFVMSIGDRRIRGVIGERQEAEKIYQEAKSQGYVASLLTQERPNIFTQSVANIEPGKQIDVEITYYHAMSYVDGWYEWSFPMVVGPRYNPAGSTGGVGAVERGAVGASGQKTEVQYLAPGERSGHDVSLSVKVNAGVKLEAIECKTHQVSIERIGEQAAAVAIVPADRVPNKDFVLRFRVAGDQIKTGVLTHHAPAGGGYFSVMLFPPADLANLEQEPVEMVFLVDVSGSMSGNPIGQCKDAMQYALGKMRPGDTFQVITFANGSRSLFDRARPVDKSSIAKARRFIDDASAGGGTEMMTGIQAAFDAPADPQRQRIVAMMTDGYVGNEDQILQAIHDKLRGARMFSFGVGGSPNRYLMEGAARVGRGAVTYLNPRDDGAKVMQAYFDRVSRPALTDLRLDFGSEARQSDLYPSRMPDLFVGRPVIVTGRFAGTLPDAIRITGKAGGRTVTLLAPVQGRTADHPAVAAVWARHRITDLTDQIVYQSSQVEWLTQQIKQTALSHNLMSQFTAFVAVDSSRVTEGDHGTTVGVPVPVPEGVKYETTVLEK